MDVVLWNINQHGVSYLYPTSLTLQVKVHLLHLVTVENGQDVFL